MVSTGVQGQEEGVIHPGQKQNVVHRNFNTRIKPLKKLNFFSYYYYVLVILNNVSDKFLLTTKLSPLHSSLGKPVSDGNVDWE